MFEHSEVFTSQHVWILMNVETLPKQYKELLLVSVEEIELVPAGYWPVAYFFTYCWCDVSLEVKKNSLLMGRCHNITYELCIYSQCLINLFKLFYYFFL